MKDFRISVVWPSSSTCDDNVDAASIDNRLAQFHRQGIVLGDAKGEEARRDATVQGYLEEQGVSLEKDFLVFLLRFVLLLLHFDCDKKCWWQCS